MKILLTLIACLWTSPLLSAQNFGQIFFSSSAATVSTTSGSFDPIPVSSFTVSLRKATNQWLYVVSGTWGVTTTANFGAMTIFRDGTNLGDATFGLIETSQQNKDIPMAGMATLDAPGDILPHTYIVKFKTGNSGFAVVFPDNANSTFQLTELVRP